MLRAQTISTHLRGIVNAVVLRTTNATTPARSTRAREATIDTETA